MSCKINWTEYNLSIPAWSNGRVGFQVQFPAMLYICVSLDILKSTLGSRLPGSIPGYPHVYNFFNSFVNLQDQLQRRHGLMVELASGFNSRPCYIPV